MACTGTLKNCRFLLKAVIASAALSLASTGHALTFTPAGICSDAGFPKSHEFRQTCVDRVYAERRSRAWREQAPAALMGAVAGIASAGGTAFGYVSVPGQTNLRQVDLEGQTFIVHEPTDKIVTVVSSEPYKNIPKTETDLWVRAAARGAGCPVTQYVRDFDALYVWTDCTSMPALPAIATTAPTTPIVAAQPVATATTTMQPSIVDELAQLATMRQKGLLSAKEFSAAKAKILNQSPK